MNYNGYYPYQPNYGGWGLPQSPAPNNSPYMKVNSFDEVRSFNIAPGASAMFLDVTKPYMYTKTADMTGVADTKAFELKEVPIDQIGVPKVDLSNYVTMDKFDNAISVILQKLDELKIDHPQKEDLL